MKTKKEKRTSIGGQAVIEGVMMRGASSMATAVRDSDGIIRLETKRIKPNKQRCLFFRLPIIRGVVAFISSLVTGTKVLLRSADVFGEGEPSKTEKWLAEKLKVNVMSVVSFFSILIGLVLAIVLFMWLPQFVRGLLENWFSTKFNLLAKNFIEGGLKLLIFIGYIFLASLIKDVRRTFMYHGAEHKTISCFELDLPLTVENAKKCTRIHDRCGTTFMIFVMVISILVFALTETLIGQSVEKGFRILLKVALLPIVAGLSYELLKLLSKTKSPLVLPLKLPGMLLQKITTREPTDDMIEVAITAFNSVLEMDSDPSVKERQFVMPEKVKDIVERVANSLADNGITERAEAEWIVSLTLNIKRDQLDSDKLVFAKDIEKINAIIDERVTGRPLWYCIGDTEFYGYTIKVDERVLIPRPETELLVEQALKCINSESSVLDLCTGSGAIAIAVQKESRAKVTAIDISADALEVAKSNAKLNNADIEFIESDLFTEIADGTDRKFDLIVSNPPYVKSSDIFSLQKEVKDFEPTLALDGGVDGLDLYKIIANNALKHLNDNGILLVECGIGQAQLIKEMLKGFASVEIINDYENIERIIKAVKNV